MNILLMHYPSEGFHAHEKVIQVPPIMLKSIEPRMVIITWACGPISIKHRCFRDPFLEPDITTRHSNIGVQLRQVTELGTSTSDRYKNQLIEKAFKIMLRSTLNPQLRETLLLLNIAWHVLTQCISQSPWITPNSSQRLSSIKKVEQSLLS